MPFRFSWRTVSLSRTLKPSAGRALRPFCWQNNFSEKQRPKMQTASVPWSFCYFEMQKLCVGRPLQYRGIPWSRLSEGIDTFISIPICGFFLHQHVICLLIFSSSTAFLDDDTPLIFDDLRCSSNLHTHQHHQKLAKLYAFTILYLLFGLLGC